MAVSTTLDLDLLRTLIPIA